MSPIKYGTIHSYTDDFEIKRDLSPWEKYDPGQHDASSLYEGYQLRVPAGVTVMVKCGCQDDYETNEIVVKVPNTVTCSVETICPLPQQTPAKLGEISEYPIGKKFKIKRHAWADFKDYHSSTWGLGLYEGDQLKVPPGVTVKVRFENNNEVQVTDNNQPWDAIENWQNL